MVDSQTGREYKLISLAEGSRHLCVVAEDTSIRVKARTRQEAERLASEKYLHRLHPGTVDEDEDDYRVSMKRLKDRTRIPFETYLLKRGLVR